jgi:hypothetical protein
MRYLMIFMALILASLPVNAGTIKKWVDEHGATHYGSTVPPQYVNQGSTEISSQGLVVKKTERAMTAEERKAQEEEKVRQKEADQKALEQQRRDKALLNTFTDEKEIDLARDRNLQQADLQVRSADLRIKQLEDRLAQLRRQADSATRSGQSVPAGVQQDITTLGRDILHMQDSNQQRKKEMEAIRAKFDADKQRYRELTLKK